MFEVGVILFGACILAFTVCYVVMAFVIIATKKSEIYRSYHKPRGGQRK